jgi:DNA polymerase elongation subunit (family B)
MGTATLWKMLMLAWSYKHKLAIPQKQEKGNFVGGLSRLLKVGFSRNVLKLDYSSLYPSIQLVHDVFPECDITGAMKGLLTYFRNSRIKFKNLASEFKNTDKKLSLTYDRKQLPIKIFINSLFGGLSAPQVFHWGDMNKGEQITCTGRQYLRQMIKFFTKRGYTASVLDTDGVNFSLPEDGVEDRTYIGKGLNWLVKEGKEYSGYDADVAEFNDLFMRGAMGLDCDGTWDSCINLARKNYATMEHNGKIKFTGNSIKSKKMPKYIEKFLDKGIKQLLKGEGKEFIEWYYEYIQKIFDQKIPLADIASKAKVKLSVDDYIKRSKQTTKSGSLMSRQAHMELIIKDKIQSNLGDMIFYVNNGTKASHGDVQKVNKLKRGWSEEQLNYYFVNNGKYPDDSLTSMIQLNCYRIEPSDLENNPEMLGEYNIQRAIATFNKRVEPLLIVFDDEVRDSLLVKNPEDRSFFTTEQCKLINGKPFKPEDQDSIEDLLTVGQDEMSFWNRVGISPNYIYDLAEPGWEELI